jgi:hypothetical protein
LVIQFTAFMMTLRRKNIVSHEVWVGTYGAVLASGFAVCTYDVLYHNNVFFFNALGNTMCLLRFGALRVNKYRACLPACLPTCLPACRRNYRHRRALPCHASC